MIRCGFYLFVARC